MIKKKSPLQNIFDSLTDDIILTHCALDLLFPHIFMTTSSICVSSLHKKHLSFSIINSQKYIHQNSATLDMSIKHRQAKRGFLSSKKNTFPEIIHPVPWHTSFSQNCTTHFVFMFNPSGGKKIFTTAYSDQWSQENKSIRC